MVRIDVITSKDPPRTRLLGKVGSYSHMAEAVSTAAIFVMWLITATFAMLMTCVKHLNCLVNGHTTNNGVGHLRELILGRVPWLIAPSIVKGFNGFTSRIIV